VRASNFNQPLTIGIVGGMSPESTITYYQHIVRRHQQELHDHSYPRIVIASVSFQQYIDWQHSGAWDLIASSLEHEFEAVARAGADFALLATNTMHKVLPAPIPILSVLDAIGEHARLSGIRTVGLTGTKFTMSGGFYVQGLEVNGLSVIVPTDGEQDLIHRIIYDELIAGRVEASSISTFAQIADHLSERGADALVLGCTELELLVRQSSLSIPSLDSTYIHAEAAWRRSIAGRLPAAS
jgi:aspartate racemase